jgi:hypothetical protein
VLGVSVKLIERETSDNVSCSVLEELTQQDDGARASRFC